ncbi:hypothetical protein [Metapseudomonas otitidis]|uniref:hypothetical protein n=1 Tax=Metapseudomonas otitidis TaxID=319939 RepID=UPI0013F661BE|nr:hypothetical protein [Pseudomonas otitidis]
MFVRDRSGRTAYISWWPDPESRETRAYHPKIPKAYDSYPIAERDYESDKANEYDKDADHTIEITGLDEEKIIDHWENFTLEQNGVRKKSGPLQPWSAINLNCSTVVFNALVAGGASKVAMNYWFSKYWTPNRVLEFAQNTKHHLHIERNNRKK